MKKFFIKEVNAKAHGLKINQTLKLVYNGKNESLFTCIYLQFHVPSLLVTENTNLNNIWICQKIIEGQFSEVDQV